MAFGDGLRPVALVYYPDEASVPAGLRKILVPTFSTETLPDSVERVLGYAYSVGDVVPDNVVRYAALFCSAEEWATARPDLKRMIGQPLPLLREMFLTDRAAGTLDGQTIPCQPGPGSLTYTDTEGKLSVSGGRLVCSGGKVAPAQGNPGVWGNAVSRACGLAIGATINLSQVSNWKFGFDANASGDSWQPVFGGVGADLRAQMVAANVPVATQVASADYLISLRSTGAYMLRRTPGDSAYTLLWVFDTDNTATLYPVIANNNSIFSAANLRVLSLAALDARFSTDDGLCTSVLTNPSANAPFVHTPDLLLEVVFNFDGGGPYVEYRKTDANNYWTLYIPTTGALWVRQVTGGTTVGRILLADGTVTAGQHRVLLVAEGNQHSVYLDNVKQGSTYTDPSNQGLAATEGKVGASYRPSRLAAYPRRITLPSGV